MTLLAMTSGAFDAIGFLGLGGVFASVMTGNLVLLGLSAGTRKGVLGAHAVVAISGFVLGAAVGARVVHDRSATVGPLWTRRLHAVLAVELFLVVAFSIGWEVARGHTSTPAQLALIGTAAVAMGLQSAAIRASTGMETSTTYLTGTLTGVISTLARGRPLRGQWTGVAVLVAALVGATLAGVTLTERSALAPAVPVVTLVGALVVSRTLVAGRGAGAPAEGVGIDTE
jgi:uncharacterized membrane protein YoaK (UPF0700 family)